ncbi:hypothetical protein [Sphaerospermopsis aphanizomenoides]|nr:hypothetical protein [Sphaerospermopsis aphanizomenoides]
MVYATLRYQNTGVQENIGEYWRSTLVTLRKGETKAFLAYFKKGG